MIIIITYLRDLFKLALSAIMKHNKCWNYNYTVILKNKNNLSKFKIISFNIFV